LKELVEGGAIGTPVAASLMWCMKKPDAYFDVGWRKGMNGAPVKQNLIHDIDTLRWLFGNVEAVAGFGSNAVRRAARTESGGAVLRFSSGVVATLVFADTTPTPWGFEAGTGESPDIPRTDQDSLRIAGTAGGVEFPSLRVWSGATSWNEAPEPRIEPAVDGIALRRQIDHFAEVINGTAAPLVTGEDGRAALADVLRIEAATLPEGLEVP
jgi:predicted dehydrogenase